MSRWSSLTLLAATVLVAAPVGSRYLAPGRTTAIVQHETRSASDTSGTDSVASAENGENLKLLASEREALEQASIDLAGVVCGFASQPVEQATHGCQASAVSGTDVMLAIVPDPVHTQLALRFDRGVDTIENELGELGWVYDRSWLPWDSIRRKPADRWQDTRTDDHLQRAVETLPGVLLFRSKSEKQGDKRRSLAVLLVGDAPTGGVNSDQFTRAIGLWRQPCALIHRTCPEVQRSSLAIFGPTFTGSLPSLDRLLKQDLQSFPCDEAQPLSVLISSGSVSDGQALETMPALPCANITVHEETFTADAGYIAQHLRQYSTVLIGNLSERETSFGSRQVFKPDSSGRTHDADRLAQYQGLLASIDCDENRARCAEINGSMQRLQHSMAVQQKRVNPSGTTVTNLTFPRGISRLRRAYEQNSIIGFVASEDTPKTQLQLSSSGDDRNDDTISSFAGSQYTLSMEAEMASLAKTLTTEHYAAVFLSATDVMDEIFVARYLSQHAPDVTVIINDADEFFLRQGQDQSLENVYTVSVWPLMERNIAWSSTHPNDLHVFPSRSDQGIASAVHHLVCSTFLQAQEAVCAPGTYREYGPPFLVNGASNDNKLEPPLWLNVIGHGGFMPVSLLDLDDTQRQLPELSELSLPRLAAVPTDPQTGVELPAPFAAHAIVEHTNAAIKLMATFVFGLLLWHGVACIRCRLDRPFAWTYARAERQQDMLRLCVRALLALLAIVAFGLLYIPDQTPVASGKVFSVESFQVHLFLVSAELLAALFSALSVWTAVQVRTRQRRRGPQLAPPTSLLQRFSYLGKTLLAYPHALTVASLYLAALVLLLALSHWNFWRLFSPSSAYPTEKVFLLYRASQPLSGASPLLPLLLLVAAGAVWAHGVFSQLAFFGHRIPQLPDGFEDIRCPSNRRVEGLNNLLSKPFDSSHLVRFTACLLVAAFMMSLPVRFGIHSFSHGPLDGWITAASLLFTAAILQDILTAARAWQQLRHSVLIPLKQSPLRWGFTWVKGFSWKRIWTSSKNLSSNQVFEYLLRLLETNSRSPGDEEVRTCYGSMLKHYAQEPKDDDWLQGFTSGVDALHLRVKHSAEKRLAQLRNEWKKDAGPLTGTEETRGMPMLQNLDQVKDEAPAHLRRSLLRRMGSEEFVALLYVGYISAVLVQIRHRIVRAAGMYILLMWALTCYPWMYRHTILLELSALLIALSAVTILVYSQMHRDDILSRTTETESGKLDSGFFEKVIPVVGVPLLTLIASQFPEFSNLIFSWIQPGLSHMQ